MDFFFVNLRSGSKTKALTSTSREFNGDILSELFCDGRWKAIWEGQMIILFEILSALKLSQELKGETRSASSTAARTHLR